MSLFLALILSILALSLFGCQRRLIYFPRRYDAGYRMLKTQLAEGLQEVIYDTSAGRQTAFYLPPRGQRSRPPERLWVFHGGNASTALDWLDLAQGIHDPRAACLLVDYPGYGLCAGRPTRTRIVESSQAALTACLTMLNSAQPAPAVRIGLMGHSLGAAATLELAIRTPAADRIVLISPFTSMLCMARRTVGWPLCHVLLDRFDNRARLAELFRRAPRPVVTIIHGTEDTIVPFAMGQSLAAMHPDWIRFISIRNGDHNYILESAGQTILAATAENTASGALDNLR